MYKYYRTVSVTLNNEVKRPQGKNNNRFNATDILLCASPTSVLGRLLAVIAAKH